jgi:class 3 adenylate cyclase
MPAAHPSSLTGTTPRLQTPIPAHLAEKILLSRGALEGERKQVTVLFADLKGSMDLLADRDPKEARQLLDPVLERMMAAMHRSEGNANPFTGEALRGVATPGAVPALRESSTALDVLVADRVPPSHCTERMPGT